MVENYYILDGVLPFIYVFSFVEWEFSETPVCGSAAWIIYTTVYPRAELHSFNPRIISS